MLHSNYLKQLDLQDIVVFINLMEQRSAKLTSELMNISQPTVSYCLKRLRGCFNDTLFFSSQGILLPTTKAERIMPYLKMIVESVNHCAENKICAPTVVKKVWQICAPEYFELFLLPLTLASVARDHTNLSLNMERLRHELPIYRLISGDVDIAVGFGPGYHQMHPELEWQPILDDKFVCVTSQPGNTPKGAMSIEKFCAAPHVFPKPWLSEKNMVDSWLEKIGCSRRVLAQANSYQACVNIVAEVPSILALPARLLPFLRIPEEVRVCKPPLGFPTFTLDIIWARERSKIQEIHNLRGLIQKVSDAYSSDK
ncbi:LysR family transcriptional regulator [Xenorhabdus bovienii]|uniref:Transcriptional regulator, LysR family n=1 Tax=Xenorhabdus bovienii str. kraussei Becker Underwood TaxID=1398204 RepID=A0A077PXJ8_XENBV|nr:LysR family transcriptional regulator [Xenorhabdus bovienii]CDH24574.1 Transcriptional regulator, LysR family [Xenorhabdus bovienii str. kraussei Becker Underwood]